MFILLARQCSRVARIPRRRRRGVLTAILTVLFRVACSRCTELTCALLLVADVPCDAAVVLIQMETCPTLRGMIHTLVPLSAIGENCRYRRAPTAIERSIMVIETVCAIRVVAAAASSSFVQENSRQNAPFHGAVLAFNVGSVRGSANPICDANLLQRLS
jgi:hypothetical protein